MNSESGENPEGGVCQICGKNHRKLYQNNTCRECLVVSFKRLKGVIDVYRDGYGNRGGKKAE
jgi:hypothetical protein